MSTHTHAIWFLVGLTLVAGGCGNKQEKPTDTGSFPDCTAGYLADRGACVPEPCGTGAWGNVEVDSSTVFVDVNAEDGGDGSELHPLTSVQGGLDAAVRRGSSLVAVAEGTYLETLTITSDHVGVHLAGRCSELVTLDASRGDETTSGILVEVGGEATISGMRIARSNYAGVRVTSGFVVLRELEIAENAWTGVMASRDSLVMPTEILMESCLVQSNRCAGVVAYGSGMQLTMLDSHVRDNLSIEDGQHGYGIDGYDGANLVLDGCEITGNQATGFMIFHDETTASLQDTLIGSTRPNDRGVAGYGVAVSSGASLTAEGCQLVDHTVTGLLVEDAGTRVEIRTSEIRDTRFAEGGTSANGATVDSGAELYLDACVIGGNGGVGLLAGDGETRLVLEETKVVSTQPNPSGSGGYGIRVLDGASLEAKDSVVEANHRGGVVASEQGTEAWLSRCLILDTQPDLQGAGYGLDIREGACLRGQDCQVEGSTDVGLVVHGVGTQVVMNGFVLRDTRTTVEGTDGFGATVQDGGLLDATDCRFEDNHSAGILTYGSGARVSLRGSEVLRTRPDAAGEFGSGIMAHSGAQLLLRQCELDDNTAAGVMLGEVGTSASIRDTTIGHTRLGLDELGATSVGLVAQKGAQAEAESLQLIGNHGPGLYAAGEGTRLDCTGCSLVDNEFAGAVVVDDASLRIRASTIEGTVEAANLGGGVGVFAAEQPQAGWSPPDLWVHDSSIADNLVAGVYLAKEGSYRLTGNHISGSVGLPHGVTTRCGDGVYALEIAAWNDSHGLFIEENTFIDNVGAGLFLDDASALLDGNAWSGNAPDLLVQGASCSSAGGDYSEVPDQDICPTWQEPTCSLVFMLNMAITDVDAARSSFRMPPPAGPLPFITPSRLSSVPAPLPPR